MVITDARIERSRALMLDAGSRLLIDEGCDALTHVRLAKEAGVGRATVYRHWPTPEDLLQDVLTNAVEMQHTNVLNGDPRHDLHSELTLLGEQLDLDNVRGVMTALIDRSRTDERFAQILQAVHDAAAEQTRRIIATATPQGRLSELPDVDTALALIMGPLLYQRLVAGSACTPKLVDAIVDTYLPIETPTDL